MREALTEIYSDKTNAAILRHPDRQYPGLLLQGDTLHILCYKMDLAMSKIDRNSASYEELNEVRNSIWDLKNHYKSVLVEHGIPMPFSEI